jgi:hypothetical protein
MKFRELNNDQRRLLIDTQQVYSELRAVGHEFDQSFKGTMRWSKISGKEYLYRRINKVNKSLGPRSPETEKIKEQYTKSRRRLRDRKNSLKKRLEEKAPLARASGLGRLENTPARILRLLDNQKLLGKSLTVVGTNALFAYEVIAGVHFETELLSTEDADLMWDIRRGLGIAGEEFNKKGLIGLLKKVDPSFEIKRKGDYRAVNKDGYYVDLIIPENADFLRSKDDRMSPSVEDLYGAPIKGLDWLVNSPKVEAILIDTRGLPLYMSCVDPRVFAVHKLWMSKQEDRNPLKKQRDREQALSVAGLVNTYFSSKFSDTDINALPKKLRVLSNELNNKGTRYLATDPNDDTNAGW